MNDERETGLIGHILTEVGAGATHLLSELAEAKRRLREYEGMMTRREVLEDLVDVGERLAALEDEGWGGFSGLRNVARQLAARGFFTCAKVLGFELPQDRDQIMSAARQELALMDAEREDHE